MNKSDLLDIMLGYVDKDIDDLIGLADDSDGGWKKASMALMVNYIKRYGPQGIALGMVAINNLMDGKEAPDLSGMDLVTASTILNTLQNAEAERKSAVNDFITKTSEILGKILVGLIKGIIA